MLLNSCPLISSLIDKINILFLLDGHKCHLKQSEGILDNISKELNGCS